MSIRFLTTNVGLRAYACRASGSAPRKDYFTSLYFDIIAKYPLVLVVQYAGMNVKDLNVLRVKFKEEGIRFLISKNKMVQQCLNHTPFSSMKPLFSSSVGMLYSEEKSAIETAKSLVRIIEEYPKQLLLVGGKWEDRLVGNQDVRQFAELPSLKELQTQLLHILQGPGYSFVNTVNYPGHFLAHSLNAHASSQKE